MEPSAAPETDRCRCGHPRVAHEHYRSGTDCALCGPALCDRYRPAVNPLRRAVAGLLRRATRFTGGS